MGTVISWIVVGLLASARAKLIIPGRQGGGWVSTIILGLIGAVVGGFIWGLFGSGGIGATFAHPWSWGSFILAVVGAIIFSVVWGFITKHRKA